MQGNIFRTTQRGLTLIECCITLAVASILVGTAAPSFTETMNKRRVDGIAGELAIDLRYVRSEAVARNEGVRITFYNGAGGQCYAIHTGNRTDCQCDGTGPARCTNGAVLLKSVFQPASQPVKLVANVDSMLFNADNGTTVPGGTVCVVPPTGKEVRHTVNIMGRVKSCVRTLPHTDCRAC
jgi:type IV fimbrial biogenesis protein FimT